MLRSRPSSRPEGAPLNPSTSPGGESSPLTRIWLTTAMHSLTCMSCNVTRFERSTHTLRDQHEHPLKSMLLTTWAYMHTCCTDSQLCMHFVTSIKYHYRRNRQPLTNRLQYTRLSSTPDTWYTSSPSTSICGVGSFRCATRRLCTTGS